MLTESPLFQHLAEQMDRLLKTPLKPGLFLVGTPIGHLSDISLRALATLQLVDKIYCEDKRHSLKLLKAYGISTPLGTYHEHNAAKTGTEILNRLEKGEKLSLISDAGMPLISDPGFKLVQSVQARGLDVTAVPGPTALTTALALSGLPTDRFFFAGFLPSKSTARQKMLVKLNQQQGTLIFYETPHRVEAAVRDINAVWPDRQLVIARELTKTFEEIWRGTPGEAVQFVQNDLTQKGEFVLLIEGFDPASQPKASEEEIFQALKENLVKMRFKESVKHVAQLYELPNREVYALGLKLKKDLTDKD